MSEKELLSFFWDLASTNENTRVEAAVGLISHLRAKENEKSIEDDAATWSNDLTYTIKRLIKGLGSSRKAARQGFAMVLTEVALLFDPITAEDIIKHMKESLVVTKSCSSQEERDIYFGQIFCYASIGRVVCLSRQQNEKPKNVRYPLCLIEMIVKGLKEISTKKSYLQEICYKAIVDLMAMLTFQQCKELVFPCLENEMKCSWEKCTPNVLILTLATWRLFKDTIDRKMFKKSWKSSELASPENYPCFARVLQNSHNSLHRVHYVWDEMLSLILNSTNADFETFWKAVIDENLFQSSSHERKFLGFKVLEKVLPMLSIEQVKVVFSPHLMHCLFNSISHNTNYLYASTKQMVEGFSKCLVKNENLIVPVMKELLGKNGNVCFDANTKTKTIENLIPKIPVEDLPELVSWMKEVFMSGTINDTEQDARNVEKTREGILGLFLSLIKCKQLRHSSSWILDAVFFVFENAYFIKKEETETTFPAVSDRTRTVSQDRFNSILGELAIAPEKPKQNVDETTEGLWKTWDTKTFGLADDGCLWIFHIMNHAKVLLKSPNFELAAKTWSDEVRKLFNKTMKISKKLEEKTGDLKLENRAFMLMFLYIGVQLFSEPQQAQEILEELFQCYDKVQIQISDKIQDREEPPWMDVITEILVSFLTDSSNLRRQVVKQVFNMIVPHLTSSALNIILEAIDPRNGLNEDSALQVESLSDDEEDENMESENDEEQDKEDESSEEDSDHMSDDNEEEETGADSIDPLFKVDLQAALGNALVNEEDDDNDSKSDDDDLDDEAMMKLDDALSEVFKQHLKAKHQKKKAKDAKQSVLHFKLRVLDLVEILVKKQPCSDLILELMPPLLNIIRACLSNKDYVTLGERAQGIFKNRLCSIKQRPEMTTSYIDKVHKNIEFLLKEAMKVRSVAMVSLMSTGCLFLIRQLHVSGNSNKDVNTDEITNEFEQLDFPRVKTAYCEALKDFMLNRNTYLHPILFEELINRQPVIGWYLAEDLVRYITEGINNYRKIQAAIMLFQLFSKTPQSHMLSHIKNLVAPLQNAFRATFLQLASSDGEMKAKYLRQILKLATRFIKVVKVDENIWSLVNTEEFEESLDAVSQSTTVERAHDLKNVVASLKSDIESGYEKTDVKRKKKRKRKRSESQQMNEQKETKKAKTKKKVKGNKK